MPTRTTEESCSAVRGAIEEVGLGTHAEVGVERASRTPVSEQVDGERCRLAHREHRSDVTPKDRRSPEPMEQDDRRSAIAESLNVHRPGSYRDAKDVGIGRDAHVR
jgi:hypothetical protein